MKLLTAALLVVTLAINVIIAGRLQNALHRIDEAEQFNVKLMSDMDTLAGCAAMCDDVILQRQNLMIVEIQRLDRNQQQLINLTVPSVEDFLEIDE